MPLWHSNFQPRRYAVQKGTGQHIAQEIILTNGHIKPLSHSVLAFLIIPSLLSLNMSDRKEIGPGLGVPDQEKDVGSVTPSVMSFADEKGPDAHSEEENEDVSRDLQRVESSQYPSGLKMLSILVGVALSVFLVALDMVIPSSR